MTNHITGDQVSVRRPLSWAACLAAGLLLVACDTTDTSPRHDTLATVGDQSITAASFRRAYIPQILYLPGDDTPASRAKMLQTLIDQKVLAQAAEWLHMDTAIVVQRAANIEERKAMVSLLYRDWVRQRVPAPTEEDLWEAFVRGQTRLLVRHLAVDTRSAADSLRRLILSGAANFDDLAHDIFEDAHLRESGGIMGWVTYGDIDKNLEDAVFAMRPGELSLPVKSIYGWHILRVDDARRSGAFDQQEFERQRDNLETRVYRRSELRMGTQILNAYMREKSIRFDQDVAAQLWAVLKPQLQGLKDNSLIIPGGRLQISNQNFGIEEGPFLDRELVHFNGGSWTVRILLDRLPEMKQKYLLGNLYTGTAYLIRDELLAREALEKKYDRDPAVIRQVRDRKDAVLAQLYLASITDTLAITPQKVRQFYEDQWQQRYYGPDSLRIQAISFDNKSAAERVLLRLRRGASFDEIMQQHTTGPAGDLGWHVAGHTSFQEFYNQGLRTKLMVPIGPVKTKDGWTVIRVTDRRRYPAPFDDIMDQVQNDLERELVDIARRQALGKLAPNINIKVDHALLDSLALDAGS